MTPLKEIVGSIIRYKNNFLFYFKEKKFIVKFFGDHGYSKIQPFNISKWHHELFLFTGKANNGDEVFIKLTKLGTILKNGNRAYKKFVKNNFLKHHLIERKKFVKRDGYKALILNRAKGVVLDEDWAIKNIEKLDVLIKIVDEFKALSLVHRDIKLDNFIYENGAIKIFDFSFMIDKTEKRKLKEIDHSDHENMLKLVDLGIYYKPNPLKWDDYFSLYVIFNKLLNSKYNLSIEQKTTLNEYKEVCKAQIGTNTYSLLK